MKKIIKIFSVMFLFLFFVNVFADYENETQEQEVNVEFVSYDTVYLDLSDLNLVPNTPDSNRNPYASSVLNINLDDVFLDLILDEVAIFDEIKEQENTEKSGEALESYPAFLNFSKTRAYDRVYEENGNYNDVYIKEFRNNEIYINKSEIILRSIFLDYPRNNQSDKITANYSLNGADQISCVTNGHPGQFMGYAASFHVVVCDIKEIKEGKNTLTLNAIDLNGNNIENEFTIYKHKNDFSVNFDNLQSFDSNFNDTLIRYYAELPTEPITGKIFQFDFSSQVNEENNLILKNTEKLTIDSFSEKNIIDQNITSTQSSLKNEFVVEGASLSNSPEETQDLSPIDKVIIKDTSSIEEIEIKYKIYAYMVSLSSTPKVIKVTAVISNPDEVFTIIDDVDFTIDFYKEYNKLNVNGDYNLLVTIIDNYGNRAFNLKQISIDKKAPELNIDCVCNALFEGNNIYTNQTNILLRGFIEDNKYDEVEVTYLLNDKEISEACIVKSAINADEQGVEFNYNSVDCNLSDINEGRNIVKIKAKDLASNETETEFIIYKTRNLFNFNFDVTEDKTIKNDLKKLK